MPIGCPAAPLLFHMHRYIIQPGTYELNVTLTYNTPVCFIGQDGSRSSVVIAPGPELNQDVRLLAYSGVASDPNTIILAHLVIDGQRKNAGLSGPGLVVLEDVTVTNCRSNFDGPGLFVSSLTATNCSLTGNVGLSSASGGAVYASDGELNFQQVIGKGGVALWFAGTPCTYAVWFACTLCLYTCLQQPSRARAAWHPIPTSSCVL